MKDIVISSKKIEKLVKKELKTRYGKLDPKIEKKVVKEVHGIFKDSVFDIVQCVDDYVEEVVQSMFSIEVMFPKKGGK